MLWYRQEPTLVTAAPTGGLTFKEVTVIGDAPEVRFARYDPLSGAETNETWIRVRTETVDGRLVSIFEPSWDAAVMQHVLRYADRGYDASITYFGRFLGPDDGVDQGVPIQVRLAPTNLPAVPVVRIDDTVQYSSHVVNLVIPSFGRNRFEDDWGFDLQDAARRFYAHFEDAYEVLSFVPEYNHASSEYSAFHRYVRNTIRGIGLSPFDVSSRYGSDGVLLGAEVFARGNIGLNSIANHELTHTWGHALNWLEIAGIDRPLERASVSGHTPLMTGGESMIGAVLWPSARVGGTDAAPAIERTPLHARQHPLELYAMGLEAPAAVPPLRVFTDQRQFDEVQVAFGAPVHGDVRTVTIDDILRVHGPRQGPVTNPVRRAGVVVTRDRLLTAEEMAHWNFLLARMEDPNRSGMFDYDGQASFSLTTDGRIELQTRIRPKRAAPLPDTYAVDHPNFGTRECIGIEFDAPLPSQFTVGTRMRLSGHVTANDRSDFHQVLVRYWRRGGTSSNAVTEWTELSRSGLFDLQLEFRDGQEGVWLFEAFLFWPDSGVQHARCSLTPVVVAPRAAATAPPARAVARPTRSGPA